MKHDNHIVYSITTNTRTGALVSVDFLNSFETPEQAKASLQYEADLYKHENGGECEWLDEDTLKLPPGSNPEEETTIHIDNGTQFHDRNERPFQYPISVDRQKQSPAQGLFQFDDKLSCDDRKMETISGYLCATSGLMTKLKTQEAELLKSGDYLDAGTGIVDSPNFYAQYNLKTGGVSILGDYWLNQLENDKIAEQHHYAVISLSKEEKVELIAAMEAYCKKQYGQTCTEFINELRREDSLTDLPDRGIERILEPLGMICSVSYQDKSVYLEDIRVFLGEDDQLYCQLSHEDTARPLRDRIQDLKAGDAFFATVHGFICTVSKDAYQNKEYADQPWCVRADDGDKYYEDDLGHEIFGRIKEFLTGIEISAPSQPSFDTLVKSAKERSASAIPGKENPLDRQTSPSRG